MSKKKRNRNPLLQKKYAEGYKQGVIDGSKNTIDYFSKRLEKLEKQKGVGPKTMQRIIDALGADYFKKGFYKSDF